MVLIEIHCMLKPGVLANTPLGNNECIKFECKMKPFEKFFENCVAVTGGKLIPWFNDVITLFLSYLKRRSNLLPLGSFEYQHTLKESCLRHVHFFSPQVIVPCFAFLTSCKKSNMACAKSVFVKINHSFPR